MARETNRERDAQETVRLALQINHAQPDNQLATAHRKAQELRRLAGYAEKRAETLCNGIERPVQLPDGRWIREGTWTDADQARHDRAIARIEKRAAELVPGYIAHAHGDPRGNCLTLTAISADEDAAMSKPEISVSGYDR